MKIETKYNLGDKVWIIDSDTLKAIECPITEVRASAQSYIDGADAPPAITYSLGASNSFWNETNLYPTKDELLKTL